MLENVNCSNLVDKLDKGEKWKKISSSLKKNSIKCALGYWIKAEKDQDVLGISKREINDSIKWGKVVNEVVNTTELKNYKKDLERLGIYVEEGDGVE